MPRSSLSLFVFAMSMVLAWVPTAQAQPTPNITFVTNDGQMDILIDGKRFATYSFIDPNNTRPYFANVVPPAGIQVTRNYPPKKGDQTDHPHHQGIFFTFGDLNGLDYWHTKGKTVHDKFVQQPKGGKGTATFAVTNRYLGKDEKRTVLTEVCQYTVRADEHGRWIEYDIKLTANEDVRIGSKEEGGVAVRVATPLAVVNGGHMTDNEGRSGGNAIWGKDPRWVDYSGELDGKYVGITVMTSPDNPRPSWWHARDYGLLAANPFGPLNDKEKGGVSLDRGESMRLRYAVLIHSHDSAKSGVVGNAYQSYAKRK